LYRQFARAIVFLQNKAFAKKPVLGRPMPWRIFCKQTIAKKRGMGTYFLTDTTNGTAS
jgi:hypothetical protein